jgi:SAM-dependent methyltransferase
MLRSARRRLAALRPGGRSTSNVAGAGERWAEGLEEETGYWFRWLRDRDKPWPENPFPEDFPWRMDPESALQPHVGAYLPSSSPDGRVRILDVGSGPLTILGKRWGALTLDIVAVDPLADRYAELFRRFGVEAVGLPVRGEAERLTEIFDEDVFDLAYARNCLDHGYDPLLSIRQMLRVVKPGGVVLIEHATDEGEFMRYAGPHQWNFRVEDGRFVIWRPSLRVDAHAALEPLADVETTVAAGDSRYMSVALRKHRGRAGRSGTR